MFYTELTFIFASIAIAAVVALLHLIKRIRYNRNRLFAFLAVQVIFLNIFHFLQLLDLETVSQVILFKLNMAVLFSITQTAFHLFQIYPDGLIRKRIRSVLAGSIPGLAALFFIFYSDTIIKDVKVDVFISVSPGRTILFYLIPLFLYSAGGVAVLIYKSRKLENRAMRHEIVYMLAGTAVNYTLVLLLLIFWPLYTGESSFRNNFTNVPHLLQLMLVHYAVWDLKSIDFRSLYRRTISWIILFMLLATPVTLGLFYGKDQLLKDEAVATGITILIFMYLFFVYRFAKPRIDSLLDRDYNQSLATLRSFFDPLESTGYTDIQEIMWSNYYKWTINSFQKSFNTESASLFVFDRKQNIFRQIHSFGPKPESSTIKEDHFIVKSLRQYSKIMDMALIHSDPELEDLREDLLKFFADNKIAIALPVFSHEENLMAFLFLGNLPDERPYTKSFISALELYRLQFQRQLDNRLTIEEVKSTQILEHDRIVTTAIKKNIAPVNLFQVPGIRISSFYVNNSQHGGDYFDSVPIARDKIAIFIADSSYAGIDSAILSLELYSILHAQRKGNLGPDEILNTMNRIVSSTEYSSKYAPACCITYETGGDLLISNAAFNPILLFNPEDHTFQGYETTGVPIGVEGDTVYSSQPIPYRNGTIGVLYSDGFASAINGRGETYDLLRVRDIIYQNRKETAAFLTRKVFTDFREHIDSVNQVNDITLIIFKIDRGTL